MHKVASPLLAARSASDKRPAMSFSRIRAAAAFAALGLCLVVAGCGGNRNKADTKYVAQDVETLYNFAYQRLEQRRYKDAAQIFDEVERQHPHPVWARSPKPLAAFSYSAATDYSQAIIWAQRFLTL